MSIFDIFEQLKQSRREETGPPEFIIAGLGNPGGEYERTRHNAGFMALDTIAARAGARCDRLKFKSLTCVAGVGGRRALLMKPATFMNLSGEALREAMGFYKIPPERALIIFDDTTLEVGRLRVRRKGSDGGHNGMKNIIYLSGSDAFPRIKIGIGARPAGWDLADWVLSRFSEKDMELLSPALERAADAAKLVLQGETEQAMALYNGQPEKKGEV